MPAIEDLLKPTSASSPSGENLRWDPIYDKIRKARRSDPPDYKMVVKFAAEALGRSKDLWIAAWLTDAMIRQQGFAGLRSGIELVQKLIESFWNGLYPESEEGNFEMRAAPLEWFGNYLELAKDSSPILSLRCVAITSSGLDSVEYQDSRAGRQGAIPTKDVDSAIEATPKSFYKTQASELAACLESLEQLHTLCKEKFGPSAPSFSKLRSELDDIQATIAVLLQKKLEKEPDPIEIGSSNEPESNGDGSSNGTANDNVVDGNVTGLEPNSPAEAVLRIAAAARYLRKTQPANPVSYLMLRALRWGELRAQNTDLKDFVFDAPTTELRTRIKSLAIAGQWVDLLEQAETAMAGVCGRGWLDLQRYSVLACEKLGHVAVARAIKGELKCLLADFPALSKAVLADDTGAANPETMVWLSEQVQR